MKHYPGNNIARKENGTGICLVMQGKESKTCPCDFTTVWFDGEKNNITSIKTLKQDDEGKLQFFRCGDFLLIYH